MPLRRYSAQLQELLIFEFGYADDGGTEGMADGLLQEYRRQPRMYMHACVILSKCLGLFAFKVSAGEIHTSIDWYRYGRAGEDGECSVDAREFAELYRYLCAQDDAYQQEQQQTKPDEHGGIAHGEFDSDSFALGDNSTGAATYEDVQIFHLKREEVLPRLVLLCSCRPPPPLNATEIQFPFTARVRRQH